MSLNDRLGSLGICAILSLFSLFFPFLFLPISSGLLLLICVGYSPELCLFVYLSIWYILALLGVIGMIENRRLDGLRIFDTRLVCLGGQPKRKTRSVSFQQKQLMPVDWHLASFDLLSSPVMTIEGLMTLPFSLL
jgi:hypothetical protein